MFTGTDPYEDINFVNKHLIITDKNGKTIFDDKIEFPDDFDDTAASIVASRYLCNSAKLKETSIKQMFDRVSETISKHGNEYDYFSNDEEMKLFENKLKYYQINKYFAFNSPVYFNVGIKDIPQTSACFILGIDDTMDSIFDVTKLESKIFKNGSGSGMNLSTLRSKKESISSGGLASGPISFMKVMDTSAGIIKSGGAIRRSAKMGCLNADHPDIVEFINCKRFEEEKLTILRDSGVDAREGYDLSDEVFFQNTNISIRMTDEFMNAVIQDKNWNLKSVKTGSVMETISAKNLLMNVAETAWKTADPGTMYHDTVNNWHTCKNSGDIVSSNPCLPIWAPVLTSTGYRYFGKLKNKIFVSGTELDCSDVIKTGENKEVFEILLKNGMTIYSTDNHKISTHRGDIEVKDLKFNDYIKMDYTPVPYVHNQDDYEKGFIAGYLFSDGSIINDASGRIYTSFSLDIEEFDLEENIIRLLNEHIPDISHLEFKPHNQKPNTCRILTLSQNQSKVIFDDIFMAHSKDSFNLLTDDKSLSFQKGFIESFITFDGHVLNRKHTKVIKGNQSGDRGFQILKQMQLSLASFGIYSSLSINNHSKTVVRDDKIYNYNTSYCLEINDVWEFAKLFTLFNKEKQKRINEIVQIPKKHPTRILNLKKYQEIKNIYKISEEDVYDINVPNGNHFVTGGAIVHNCGEYLFINDSSCNLASVNLLKFFSIDNNYNITFDYETFEDVIKTVFTAQDIIINFSSYPSEKIEYNSKNFRPIGLGYTNLGALLMWLGLPYDGEEGRYITSAITALLQGISFNTSFSLAERLGSFTQLEKNIPCYQDVITKHYLCVKNLINHSTINKNQSWKYDIIKTLDHIWSKVYDYRNSANFKIRNAQMSVIAPTGTISFLMNAITTGCEPEFSLVKYKRLSGSNGATIKIVNPIIAECLYNLKIYSGDTIAKIIKYVEDNDTLEDCPFLDKDHLSIFDTSIPSGNGTRSISWKAHLLMCAAIQPYISGAISKTINVPNNFTVQEIFDLYIDAWTLGLKGVTVYRDGSKTFQALSTKKTDDSIINNKDENIPIRKKLPNEREAINHAFRIGGIKGYLTCGMYPDTKKLGEIFINISKEGSTLSGFADAFATIVSIALQYNVPLKDFVKKMSHLKFEPNGFTNNPDIRIAHSIIDYIFRYLGIKFLSEEDKQELGLTKIIEEINHIENLNSFENNDISSSPVCPECGSIMIRKGTCYFCNSCAYNSGSCG